MFPAKWTRIGDVGLSDLRSLLFALNSIEGCSPLVKGYSKEQLLPVVEYVTGLAPSEPLETRYRN